MKHILISILFLTFPLAAVAQTITLGSITKIVYCVGDTMLVPYTAQGSFNPGNVFKVQVSDAGGSFATFTSIGQDPLMNDSILVVMSNSGSYRVRIISTAPYKISDSNARVIQVLPYPAPSPGPLALGFIGDSIAFVDHGSEASGAKYLWTFDGDASTPTSSLPSLKVVYASEGVKTGKLTVTNSVGCSTTVSFSAQIFSCTPLIPRNVHVVTGMESGSDASVLVLPGGNYTATHELERQTIFVESGGSLTSSWRSVGLYYLKAGASFSNQAGPFGQTVVKDASFHLQDSSYISVFSCAGLAFDYSRLGVDASEPASPVISLHQSGDVLTAHSSGSAMEIRIADILGAELLSRRGANDVELDLTQIPTGIYFAVVQAGEQREVRRILVTH